jgi:RNA polymerase sigma-70 factor (ECF subfamily)
MITFRKAHLDGSAAPKSGCMPSTLHDLDDVDLVAAVRRSDESALAELYRRHSRGVYGLARRVVNDGGMAEEIVQEVFLRLWNEPERFDPRRGALRSFLYRQSHGRAVDRVRSEEARRRREARDERERELLPDIDIEREVWDMIRADQVRSALDRLNDGERDAINLAFFGGHTYREVAVLLDLPEGTVKSRIRIGLTKLADGLDPRGVDDER